jgi:rod shape-determining protein MreC
MKPRDRSLSSSRTVSLLVTLVIVSLVLILVSQSPQLQPVQDAVHTAIAPIQNGINGASTTAGGWIETVRRGDEIRRENVQLKQDIESLTSENSRLRELERENADLRRQLNFEREFPDLRGKGAVVLSRDPSGLNQILVIDKGTADGIIAGQAVTDSGGYFIGRIRTVTGDHQAEVLLITDVDSSVAVYVDRTGTDGVANGRWPRGRLSVEHLSQDANLGKGDLLKTSGRELVPRGLILGQIYNIVSNDVLLEQQADAYPLADLGAIDQVLVILGGQGLPQPTATPTPLPTATVTPLPTLTTTPTPRPSATPRTKK